MDWQNEKLQLDSQLSVFKENIQWAKEYLETKIYNLFLYYLYQAPK